MAENDLASLSPSPNPLPRGEGFAIAAARLAGMAGAVLGWRAGEFWNATPAELAVVIGFLVPEGDGVERVDLERLMEAYPDG